MSPNSPLSNAIDLDSGPARFAPLHPKAAQKHTRSDFILGGAGTASSRGSSRSGKRQTAVIPDAWDRLEKQEVYAFGANESSQLGHGDTLQVQNQHPFMHSQPHFWHGGTLQVQIVDSFSSV